MQPYSTDLRERAVQSVESGACTIPQAAKRFRVGEPSIERWLARKLALAETVIRVAVKAHPDATLSELCEAVERETGIVASPSMMCRDLVRLKLLLKKSRFMPASATGHE